MTPKEILEQWVTLFNEGNAQELARLYHTDAVNHQVTNDPAIGRNEIFRMFQSEFENAEMTCIPENIFQDGNWAILEWKDPLGLRGCGFFEIINGKIKFQRGYWDKLSFLKQHNLPFPKN